MDGADAAAAAAVAAVVVAVAVPAAAVTVTVTVTLAVVVVVVVVVVVAVFFVAVATVGFVSKSLKGPLFFQIIHDSAYPWNFSSGLGTTGIKLYKMMSFHDSLNFWSYITSWSHYVMPRCAPGVDSRLIEVRCSTEQLPFATKRIVITQCHWASPKIEDERSL